jgi:hypothetical protein
VRLGDGECERVAARTGGFSYAYLKELMVSSLMRWIDHGDAALPLADVVGRQIEILRQQMAQAPSPPTGGAHESDDDEM